MRKPNYILEIYKDRKKEFRFRLLHRNGNEIFKSSEGYKRKATMIRILKAVIWQDPEQLEVTDLTEE